MKRILITGGSGFVGRHLLPLFEGEEVHVFDKASGNFPGVIWHEVDLGNICEMDDRMKKVRPTHLIHTAWHVPPQEFWTSTENVVWVYRSFEVFKSFANHGGSRAILLGSCAEYEWQDRTLCSETKSRLIPSSFYGICKKSLFEICSEFARLKGVSLSWARLFFMFGDGEPPTKYVRHLMESLLAGKRVTCRFPDVIRDYLAVEEVASALRILLESPVEGAINIGSGEAVSVGTLTRFIGELAKRPDLIDYGEIVDLNEPTYIVADTTKLLGNVGWKPQVSNAEYLRTFFKRLAD